MQYKAMHLIMWVSEVHMHVAMHDNNLPPYLLQPTDVTSMANARNT